MTGRPTEPDISVLDGPGGPIRYLTTGSGTPATIFAHGLAGSIRTTRPFGSGVAGSRTFLQFRGEDEAVAPRPPWSYAALAGQLAAVADQVGATQALGVSMGAGALCTLLGSAPLRFGRLVFVMPAVLDQPRADGALDRLEAMARCSDNLDVEGLTLLLLQAEPALVRTQPAVQQWCRRQALAMVGTSVSTALRALPNAVPLTDRGVLAAVSAPALVIAQEGDPAHPVWEAEQLAASLPNARLEVLAPGGILWRHRTVLRRLLGGFLSGQE